MTAIFQNLKKRVSIKKGMNLFFIDQEIITNELKLQGNRMPHEVAQSFLPDIFKQTLDSLSAQNILTDSAASGLDELISELFLNFMTWPF